MIESASIPWVVLSGARALLLELRQAIGVEAYEAEKDARKRLPLRLLRQR
ncbi:MAG: hypothetical protein IPN34_19135 [Planctomycetes bacterium]|nr:hypothetical protein [Planctomycetota bacterium]